MTLPSLLSRVEAAAGPDRELDGAVYWHLLESNKEERPLIFVVTQFVLTPAPSNGDWRAPYTASIDASLALCERVLPCRDISLDTTLLAYDGHVHRVCDATIGLAPYSNGKPTHAYAKSPARALLAAILRAKIAEGAE